MGIQTITFTNPFMLGGKTSIDACMKILHMHEHALLLKYIIMDKN
jgi:hypothetical protein